MPGSLRALRFLARVICECHDKVEIAQLLEAGAYGSVIADRGFKGAEAVTDLTLLRNGDNANNQRCEFFERDALYSHASRKAPELFRC
jgi:hypothetical protein